MASHGAAVDFFDNLLDDDASSTSSPTPPLVPTSAGTTTNPFSPPPASAEQSSAAAAQSPCPVCDKLFWSPSRLETHVNACLDGRGDEFPPDDAPSSGVEPGAGDGPGNLGVQQQQQQEQPQDNADDDDPFVIAQRKALERWQEERVQEARDAELARKLMEGSGSIPTEDVAVDEGRRTLTMSADERLAKELADKDEELAQAARARRESESDDARLARQLEEEMREADRQADSIRAAARAESDEAMAKLLREREELQRQLEEARRAADASPVSGGPVSEVSLTLSDIQYPDTWEHQVADYQSFDVPQYSDEYNFVSGEFLKGMAGTHIRRIERVQNKTRYSFFYMKRALLDAKNKKNKNANYSANETWLWHGSRNDAYDMILRDGFDHRVANMGGAIGAGVFRLLWCIPTSRDG
jgi:Poly(ADP-ribose) polymerase catalytic domain